MDHNFTMRQIILKKETLEELREIIKEDFGKNLNDKELFEFGSCLLSYFELLARISFQNQLNNSKKKTVKMGSNLTFLKNSIK